MADVVGSKVSNWMFFLGVLFLLMGAYGFVRMLHIQVRSVPYPAKGVYPTMLLLPGNSSFSTRESECDPYPQVYYDYGTDGKQTAREANAEEIQVQDQLVARCVNGFDEDRSKQKQYDKNQAAFLTFVGLGLIFSRRFLD